MTIISETLPGSPSSSLPVGFTPQIALTTTIGPDRTIDVVGKHCSGPSSNFLARLADNWTKNVQVDQDKSIGAVMSGASSAGIYEYAMKRLTDIAWLTQSAIETDRVDYQIVATDKFDVMSPITRDGKLIEDEGGDLSNRLARLGLEGPCKQYIYSKERS